MVLESSWWVFCCRIDNPIFLMARHNSYDEVPEVRSDIDLWVQKENFQSVWEEIVFCDGTS